MSNALPGEHLCSDHQGNHSHYDKKNCTVCRLTAERDALRAALVEYGWHNAGCMYGINDRACDCGFHEAINAAREAT